MSRMFLAVLAVVCLSCGSSEAPKAEERAAPAVEAVAAAPEVAMDAEGSGPRTPPETILFVSEYGNVTFTHQQHFERVNHDCATCHPKIFPMAREPLNYGKARHRSAEEYGTSCAACHGIKATAFAAERNCQKCHDMGPKR